MSIADIQPLVVGALQGILSSSAFVLVLFIVLTILAAIKFRIEQLRTA